MTAVFTIKQDDTFPVLEVGCRQGDGSPLPLTTATGVRFRMWAEGNLKPVIDEAAAVVVDADTGVVRYLWAPKDTAVPGSYKGEFVVDFPGVDQQTVPTIGAISIRVTARGPVG